ncbi:dUTP diphosphatase [Hyphomicrobium sulfonivorans]|nr:dUTP diphosphatase [Hyphomicrobium sulfonivorans]NSL73277.1 dUTP diphosphatase [Hyphomicrobium sulfonivorans]
MTTKGKPASKAAAVRRAAVRATKPTRVSAPGKPARTAAPAQSKQKKSSTATRAVKNKVKVRVVQLAHGQGLPLPAYQTSGAAGMDLLAAIDVAHPITLAPGARALVPTGLTIELPQGYEAQVRPRSGLALKNGVTVLNSPGTVDSDYRGEVGVILANLGQAPFDIRRGDRIAQMVIAAVLQATLVEVKTISNTARGDGGFGSTGKTIAKQKATLRKSRDKKKAIPPLAAAPKKSGSSKARTRNR